MSQTTVVESKANWNGPILTKIPAEELSKMRRWLLGGGILLIALGIWDLWDDLLKGILEVITGIIITFLELFFEYIKNKKTFYGTSIDFPAEHLNLLYNICEEFLKENGYYYEKMEENYSVVKGKGFEIQPSGIRLVLFDVKAPISGHIARVGIRNIDESNQQQAIELQVKLDNYFLKKNLVGKNRLNVRTRYEWDGRKYIPMR